MNKQFGYIFGITTLMVYALVTMQPSARKYEVDYDQNRAVSFKSVLEKRSPAGLKARGLNVFIAEGEIAYLDESTNIDTLTINGELHCDEANADQVVELRVKTIYVNGTFQCGTNTNPYNKKLIISLKDSNIDPKQDPAYRGIIVMGGGKLILNGDIKKAGWTKLGATANPGDNFIILKSHKLIAEPTDPVQIKRSGGTRLKRFKKRLRRKINRTRRKIKRRGSRFSRVRRPSSLSVQMHQYKPSYPYHGKKHKWKVGDEIAIGPTGYNYAEAEKFKITGFDNRDPHKVYIDGTIQYKHWGETQTYQSQAMGKVILDERAEVANLTRNIVIRADEKDGQIPEGTGATDQRGGHIMIHHMGKGYLNGVELYKLGQAGVMARYPFHWHHVGNAPGQYVKNSSIHHSFQRCITIHRTNKVLLQNNVCFDFKGHGYFLEDGTEQNNKIIHNLAIMAKAPSTNKLLLASDDITKSEGQGRFPSVSSFWISHPNNFIVNNVASGSIGTGFWMSFEDKVFGMGSQSSTVVATPRTSNTDTFSYNQAHATKVGITWDGAPMHWMPSANNPNNPNDRRLTSSHYDPPLTPTFRGLRAWKNKLSGIYFRGDTVVYKNAIVADNGWSFWTAYNQIIRDSVFIGETNNKDDDMDEFYYENQRHGRYRKTGMVLYDGPFEIHNADFLDFSTTPRDYTLNNGQTKNTTVVPFTSTGGSNKFTNIVSGLRFSPEPAYRAHMESDTEYPHGRQMLGNAVIRDKDGTLSDTGVNSVVVGKNSLGISPFHGCSDGGDMLRNFKVCPQHYTEGSLAFMRWGSNYASPWATPFAVIRSDGKTNYPKEQFSSISYYANNLFATINSMDYSYWLMPKYQYERDRQIGATARLDANTESVNPIIPVVKVVAYGNNCKLNDGAIEANSLEDLKDATSTAYYTNGEDFYVRIIPEEKWNPIADDQFIQAQDRASNKRFGIECDEGYLPYKVKGKITGVTYGSTHTTVRGWACNYTHNSPIQVKLFAYGPALPVEVDPDVYKGIKSGRISLPNTYSFIEQEYSNKESKARVAFNCGKVTSAGRGFEIQIPNEDLKKFKRHTFAVKGLSNSNGNDSFLDNSRKWRVIKPRIIIDTYDEFERLGKDPR